jgi:hypothetical protein
LGFSLVILAAGLSTRYGRPKQLEPVGPSGEALLDYTIYDARLAGFSKIILVVRPEQEGAFRDHAHRVFGDRVKVAFAHQELWDLPAGFAPPTARHKPWGTGHAVLAVRKLVDGPFAICNADDFYGASAYSALTDFFRNAVSSGDPSFAMVGFTLRNTLSSLGGVSRGICRCDNDGFLQRIVEVREIHENSGLSGVSLSGDPYVLTGDELTSMNLWGFRRRVFARLDRQFELFLNLYETDPEAEFLLSDAIGEQVSRGESRVRVLPRRDPWIGMTFEGDRERVESHIRLLVAEGRYPVDLADWFRNER